jgi:hypothetical protein
MLAGGELAGQNLVSGVAQRRTERVSHTGAEQAAAGPGNQQHANEAGDGRQPGSQAHRLAEQRRGEQSHQQRRDEDQGRRFGQRQCLQRQLTEQRDGDQRQATQAHQPRPLGDDQAAPHARRNGEQHDHQVHQIARPDQQRHGEKGTEMFGGRVERGEKE